MGGGNGALANSGGTLLQSFQNIKRRRTVGGDKDGYYVLGK